MRTWLARILPVHSGERVAVGVLFTHYFLVSAAVIAGKSARDAFFLSRYDNSLLPLMYLANAVSVALVMAMLPRLMKRFTPGNGTALTLGFFSLTLLLIELNLDGWMIGVLYVWMEVIGTVVILQSWLLTGNAFDPRQAKRLFGVIAAGGSIAAWAGGVSIAWVAARFGSSLLITLVAVALAVSMCTAWYGARFQAPRPRARSAPKPVGGRQRRLSPYVVSIAMVIASASMVSAVIQYRFQVAAVVAYPSRDQLVAFFGQFYAWTGAASLASQLFLSSFLLSRFGVIAGLFVLPASFAAGSLLTLVSPSLWSAGFGRFSDLTFKFTVNNSSLEMLWVPVPPKERQSVKPLISGTLKAVSEAGTALLMFVLVKFTPAWALSAFALSICSVWVLTVLRLRAQYTQALVSVIEKRQLDAEALRLSATDPVVVESINRGLRSPDETEQIAALGFLDGLPLQPWSAAIRELLANGSPEIRERVLLLAANDRTILPDKSILAIARTSGVLASTAVEVAAARGLRQVHDLLADLVASRDARTSIAAASAMLRHNVADGGGARAVLARWLDSADTVAITQVLRLLPSDSSMLPPAKLSALLQHRSRSVRVAAIEAVAARRELTLLAHTMRALADPSCARSVKVALRQMPSDVVVESLVATANDTTDARLKRALLRMLREYPETVPEDQVASRIGSGDLSTYSEFAGLLCAIRNLRPLQEGVFSRVLQDRSTIRTEAYLSDAVRMQLEDDPDAILLRDHVSQRYTQAVGATLRLTAVQHPGFPVDACLHAASSGDRAMMPYVLELIETTLAGDDNRLLAPLVDDSQIERRQSIARELLANPESLVEQRVREAACSTDAWEAAIAADYLQRKGKLAGGATPNGMGPQDQTMYTTLDKTILLKSSDLFGGLPAENLATLASIATEVRSAAGTILFRDGDAGDSLYVVTSGRVRIVKGGSEIAVLEKGACFGEMAVLDQALRSADAVIADEAVLLRIGSEEFYDVLAESPALTQGVVRLLTRRLREANARIAKTEC